MSLSNASGLVRAHIPGRGQEQLRRGVEDREASEELVAHAATLRLERDSLSSNAMSLRALQWHTIAVRRQRLLVWKNVRRSIASENVKFGERICASTCPTFTNVRLPKPGPSVALTGWKRGIDGLLAQRADGEGQQPLVVRSHVRRRTKRAVEQIEDRVHDIRKARLSGHRDECEQVRPRLHEVEERGRHAEWVDRLDPLHPQEDTAAVLEDSGHGMHLMMTHEGKSPQNSPIRPIAAPSTCCTVA
jgi:hypothetical protein